MQQPAAFKSATLPIPGKGTKFFMAWQGSNGVCFYGRSLLEIGSLKCVPCTSPSAFRYHLFLSWRTHYCTYRGISCREWNVQQCIPLRTLLVGSINAISFWFLPVPAGTYQPAARREPSQVSMNLQSNLFYGCGVVIKHWSNYTTESIG